ncbi:uncharacterized protein LOC121049152 [Rosa chinensis]|uniref:uncharacterized protein LOC121049152 n=1 Tax=Rosa chinensis TaxID=74649 RepID=UPI001AD9389B|nr:uncharacterized protein LOC121049152 [Rosa chinensis]
MGLNYRAALSNIINFKREAFGFQRRRKLIEGWVAKPIWKQADPRFVWNKNLLDELIEFKVRFSYCKVRLVQGPNYVVSVPLVYETLYRGIQKQISTSSKARKLIALSFLRISLAYMEFKRIYEVELLCIFRKLIALSFLQ